MTTGRRGANIAIVGGKLLIVDVDLHADGADESFAKAEAELGTLPRDWMVSTGGGGMHLYFTLPEGVKIGCQNGWPGVDIKSSGGYGVPRRVFINLVAICLGQSG